MQGFKNPNKTYTNTERIQIMNMIVPLVVLRVEMNMTFSILEIVLYFILFYSKFSFIHVHFKIEYVRIC